jgi:hypothetical protein
MGTWSKSCLSCFRAVSFSLLPGATWMPKPPLTPTDDPAWSNYAETILEIEHDGAPLVIDLRQPLEQDFRRALATLGPASSFGIVTAANPAGAPVAPTSNEARHDALRRHLVEHGYVHRATTGSSPDGKHRERGFAVWLERDDVVAIAKRFEQSAIFWFDGGAFWLVGALVGAPARRLP